MLQCYCYTQGQPIVVNIRLWGLEEITGSKYLMCKYMWTHLPSAPKVGYGSHGAATETNRNKTVFIKWFGCQSHSHPVSSFFGSSRSSDTDFLRGRGAFEYTSNPKSIESGPNTPNRSSHKKNPRRNPSKADLEKLATQSNRLKSAWVGTLHGRVLNMFDIRHASRGSSRQDTSRKVRLSKWWATVTAKNKQWNPLPPRRTVPQVKNSNKILQLRVSQCLSHELRCTRDIGEFQHNLSWYPPS